MVCQRGRGDMSKMFIRNEGGMIMSEQQPEQPGFKVGDKVQWMHTGRSSWTLRKGVIEIIQGDVAIVRYGKKTLCKVPLSGLNEEAKVQMGRIVGRFR